MRDNMPHLAMNKGKKIVYHTAENIEYWHKLKAKLQEEIDEFGKSENMETFVDVLEVIDAICDFKKFDKRELQALRENKAIEQGKFEKKYILEESEEYLGPPIEN